MVAMVVTDDNVHNGNNENDIYNSNNNSDNVTTPLPMPPPSPPSAALVDSYPRPQAAHETALLSAGAGGRRGSNCSSAHLSCPDEKWAELDGLFDVVDFDFELPTKALQEELGLPDLASVLDVASFASGGVEGGADGLLAPRHAHAKGEL